MVMKLNAAVNRLSGAKNNVQNGISFVEIQDGVLETVGRIVGRMAELKGMATQDPMKSSQDVEVLQQRVRGFAEATLRHLTIDLQWSQSVRGSKRLIPMAQWDTEQSSGEHLG